MILLPLNTDGAAGRVGCLGSVPVSLVDIQTNQEHRYIPADEVGPLFGVKLQ